MGPVCGRFHFCDHSSGEALLSDRRATLKGLYLLRDIYKKQGGEHFLREIGGASELAAGSGYLNMYVEQLQEFYSQTKDVQGTYNKLQAWIEIAKARRQLLE